MLIPLYDIESNAMIVLIDISLCAVYSLFRSLQENFPIENMINSLGRERSSFNESEKKATHFSLKWKKDANREKTPACRQPNALGTFKLD